MSVSTRCKACSESRRNLIETTRKLMDGIDRSPKGDVDGEVMNILTSLTQITRRAAIFRVALLTLAPPEAGTRVFPHPQPGLYPALIPSTRAGSLLQRMFR